MRNRGTEKTGLLLEDWERPFTPMEIDEILQQLEFNTGKFPRRAVEAAVACTEGIIPELLRILEHAVENPEAIEREQGYMAHIYAMFLLAQFRETKAYPLIVRFCQLPGELPLDLTGDVITEDMDRILASVCGGETRLIEGLIENPDVNEYVRNAACRSLTALVADGALARETVVSYYKSLFSGKLEPFFSFVWTGLATCCDRIYPEELIEDLRRAFEEELVDEGYIALEDLEGTLRESKETVLARLRSRYQGLIQDTIVEMQGWACFEKDRKWKKQKQKVPVRHLPDLSEPKPESKKKIGRNEPCPCGSGKKYKKCCGRAV